MTDRVVSGIQPSGQLHLGNYLGAILPQLELQAQYPGETYLFIADYHALTTVKDPQQLRDYVFDAAATYLALGLDPDKALLFRQSDVPEVTELAWLLATVTGMGLLERSPSYKDKLANGITPSVGLFFYPLLMAADILAYGSHRVPVGKDQVQHVEMAQDMAGSFNAAFKHEVFVRPEYRINAATAKVPGTDGQKMSKSYGNTIDLSDDAETVRKKVMQMYTDPKRIRADIPGTVEGNPVFMYHDAFNPNVAEVDDLKSRYREGKVGDVEVKTKLAAALNAYLDPMRARRLELLARPDTLREILFEGSRTARGIAHETMERVRAAVRLKY